MAKMLWKPSATRAEASKMYGLLGRINRDFKQNLKSYEDLHRWSVENIADFWQLAADVMDIRFRKPARQIVDDPKKMPGAKWFAGAELNFAENLLKFRDDHLAIIFKGEGQPIRRMTHAQLYSEVAQVASALRKQGVKKGDRVVGFVPNMPEAIIAMLAASSIGALWSSCSPDFGIKGVLDRFGQIEPKVLFTADGYFFKGKAFDSLEKLSAILRSIPSIEKTVVIPYTKDTADVSQVKNGIAYGDFKVSSASEVEFESLPFEHPLYIMYSSGTTGLPKCMVQSQGGVLIQQLKEQMLQTDVNRNDRVFYFTTCGWMMWNWLVSGLAAGTTLMLFDGNPFHPGPEALWEFAEEEEMTVFGTSAGYIAALQASGFEPKSRFKLPKLRAILSTGSPLSEEGFQFIYDSVKSDVQLASISGGSDLNSCFALGNPLLPVYSGELQARGLGMDVHAFGPDGKPVIGEQGELVCTQAFPSMPLYFWNDSDGSRYHKAYFDHYPGIWRHGDFITINDRGGVTIYGRSDATLNPGGVRIGTAEIYRVVEGLPEVADSIVIGQPWKNDVRVVLFVKLAESHKLTDDLQKTIRQKLKSETSPRHVPAKILAVPDIPYTLNMKKVELAVRNVVENKTILNQDALKNPEVLEAYRNLAELRAD